METKLTLRIDYVVIARAKRWAKARGVSLSQAVSSFFDNMTETRRPSQPVLSPWVKRLSIRNSPYRSVSDEEIQDRRHSELERKHR